MIAAGAEANVLQLHHDLPVDADAWDVDEGTFDRATELTGGIESLNVVEHGPVRAAARLVRRFGHSRLTQEIRLLAGSRRVDFVTEVDWGERHKFLKVAFPVAVRSQFASFEVQFGYVQRPTHANTSWDAARFEVAAQRWADLSEPGFGVALLNDCKHGYDVRGNVLRLSLLRGPTWPDPTADAGRHHFSYASSRTAASGRRALRPTREPCRWSRRPRHSTFRSEPCRSIAPTVTKAHPRRAAGSSPPPPHSSACRAPCFRA